MTSHDVVDALRRLVGIRRVGHTGTLDPGAAGVLVCCVGRATRLSEFLMDADKEYRVELRLGMATTTGDAYGEALPAADPLAASRPVSRAALEGALKRFTGDILQVPPMVSAIHHGGTRLYRLARRGEVVEREPRKVSVYRIDVLCCASDGRTALLHVSCGKGTYIRTLCADIGEALGVGGYAHFMIRTRAGQFELEDAWTLEELGAAAERGELREAAASMDRAVSHLPAVDLPDRAVTDVLNGHPVPVWKLGDAAVSEDSPVRLRSRQGTLVALARVEEGALRPFKVLAGPEGGGAVAHRARPR
jgi:tRNA pseudouridine55 synthase